MRLIKKNINKSYILFSLSKIKVIYYDLELLNMFKSKPRILYPMTRREKRGFV